MMGSIDGPDEAYVRLHTDVLAVSVHTRLSS